MINDHAVAASKALAMHLTEVLDCPFPVAGVISSDLGDNTELISVICKVRLEHMPELVQALLDTTDKVMGKYYGEFSNRKADA